MPPCLRFSDLQKFLPFLCLKLCILSGDFNSFFSKNLPWERFCKKFVSVGFIPIGWNARTGRETPGRQDGGVGGTGCKAPTMNPALQPGSQQCALPRKRRKADPSGVRQARHLDQTPDGHFGTSPLREVPPAVLLAQFRLILPEATAMGVRLSHASHGAPFGEHRRTAQ